MFEYSEATYIRTYNPRASSHKVASKFVRSWTEVCMKFVLSWPEFRTKVTRMYVHISYEVAELCIKLVRTSYKVTLNFIQIFLVKFTLKWKHSFCTYHTYTIVKTALKYLLPVDGWVHVCAQVRCSGQPLNIFEKYARGSDPALAAGWGRGEKTQTPFTVLTLGKLDV